MTTAASSASHQAESSATDGSLEAPRAGSAELRDADADADADEPLAVIPGVIGLRVPGALAYRHLAIRLVTTACKMAIEGDPGEGEADFEAEVVSAFGEAFNNIAVHGFHGRDPEPVQIEVDWDDEKLVITCVDRGSTFDPDAVAAPDLDGLPEHGMGLFIMRTCMDRVDYRPGPPNVLRMVKLRARRDGMLPPPPSSGAVEAGTETTGTPDGERGSGVDLITGSDGGTGARAWASAGDDRKVESSRRR